MFSTAFASRKILDDMLHARPDYIEYQLVHVVRDPNGRTYSRTAHWEERKQMMQQSANYQDKLKTKA